MSIIPRSTGNTRTSHPEVFCVSACELISVIDKRFPAINNAKARSEPALTTIPGCCQLN